jgi:hypothetical protein
VFLPSAHVSFQAVPFSIKTTFLMSSCNINWPCPLQYRNSNQFSGQYRQELSASLHDKRRWRCSHSSCWWDADHHRWQCNIPWNVKSSTQRSPNMWEDLRHDTTYIWHSFSTDMYREHWVKFMERKQRSCGCAEKIILKEESTKRPADWMSFLSIDENKKDYSFAGWCLEQRCFHSQTERGERGSY